MKLIVGLGNPGEKYEKTRHNTGWLVLEAFAQKYQKSNINPPAGGQNDTLKFKIKKKLKAETYELAVGNRRILLVKPLTFMNNSGNAVKRLLQYNNITIEQYNNCFYLIHDDLDIPLGKYKIQFGKGPREHNGVESVEKALGTKDFWRVRVGIENRTQEQKRISGEEYVLQKFTKEEKEVINQVILEAVEEIQKRLDLF